MAALSATNLKNRRRRGLEHMRTVEVLAADSQTFYAGGAVMINASGLAVVGDATTAMYAVGVAGEDLVTGSSNTKTLKVEFGHEEWFPRESAITQADLFKMAYIEDDNLVTDAGGQALTTGVALGPIRELQTFDGQIGCWVHVLGPAPYAVSAT